MPLFLFLLFFFPFSTCVAQQTADSRAISYLLPKYHPVKILLDDIFQASERVIFDLDSLILYGGFENLYRRTDLSLTIASHPLLRGYRIKVFLDTQPAYDELDNFIRRIEGAHATRRAIAKHRFEKWFQVPSKYLYEIPEPPFPREGTAPKKYLLIVEDMDIFSPHANQTKWISDAVSKELLDALFVVITEVGLYDSLYIDNIPFSKNGKISFIDLEHHHGWPIDYGRLLPYLRPGMQEHWRRLMQAR